MRYIDYVQLNYKPAKQDLICEFYVEPAGISMKETAGAVASESSVGTWTEVTEAPPRINKLAAKVFSIKGPYVKVAYPVELFEPGNMPQILSSIAGNIFGMKAVRNLKLLDIHFPEKIVKSFKGPQIGLEEIRKMLGIKNRPLVGTIVKPKVGLNSKEHARVAYDAWRGGLNLVKFDENLTNQSFNRFETNVRETLKMLEKAEKETGERKVYAANVTAETNEMIRRAKLVKKLGGNCIMIDIITAGWSALQTLRNENLGLIIHSHRAGYAALSRNPKHGISMLVIAKIARLIGTSQIHTGTANVGKMESGEEETEKINSFLRSKWFNIKPVFPIASGGLHPGSIPKLVKILGKDIICQFGGGCHGHPGGTYYGAKAIRQAAEAVTKGISLKKYAKKHKELDMALAKWKS